MKVVYVFKSPSPAASPQFRIEVELELTDGSNSCAEENLNRAWSSLRQRLTLNLEESTMKKLRQDFFLFGIFDQKQKAAG